MKKIILSNKAKKHMKAHRNDFLVSWEELVEECKVKGIFENLSNSFEILKVEFNRVIGYCGLMEVNQNEAIVYAKRKGRDTYTKFVKDRKAETTNNLVIILNRSYSSLNEYYLVTMYPGVTALKEPEDRNITSKSELIQSLNFWSKHALIYDEDIIDIDTIVNYCPYKNLYLAIA